jgi:hypothetical protein
VRPQEPDRAVRAVGQERQDRQGRDGGGEGHEQGWGEQSDEQHPPKRADQERKKCHASSTAQPAAAGVMPRTNPYRTELRRTPPNTAEHSWYTGVFPILVGTHQEVTGGRPRRRAWHHRCAGG